MAISKEFKDRLNELSDEISGNKSQKNLALGIDYRSFSNALNYGILPSTRTIMKIADYFNVPVDYLLGKTDDYAYIKAAKPVDFNVRFHALCVEYGTSYAQVSQDCKFNRNYPNRWRSSNLIPTIEIVERIADYFNVSVDYLLGRTDEKN